MISDTELRLSFWRDGSTNAERLAAAALRLSGYEQIDPQSPLGGPDGKKDILCIKGGINWVAAVYFPIGPVSFAAIKKKFRSDLLGMPNAIQGFVFVTNQTLSPTKRQLLVSLAVAETKEVDILHLQQLQTLLDSPSGYGIRIQFLKIPMAIEEQLSWAVDSDSQTAKALSVNTRELWALRSSVEQLKLGQTHILKTINQVIPPVASTPDLLSLSSFQKNDSFDFVTKNLTPELVLLFHRLLCFNLPTRAIGRLRTDEVWLGNLEGKRATHVQPPAASEVKSMLIAICDDWRARFLKNRTHAEKIKSIADFHAKLLVIHPFWDGNGRVARAITMQQALDFFGKADMTLMDRGADYYAALEAADKGNLEPLCNVLEPIVK